MASTPSDPEAVGVDPRRQRRQRLRRGVWGLAVAALVVSVSIAVVWLVSTGRSLAAGGDGGPEAGSEASSGGAPYEGTALNDPAPGFRLVDHRGRTVSLADFRGQVVVLAFLDSRCDETCPLTAQELRAASHTLGAAAEDVVFLGVNVNAVFNTPADVARFTAEQGLGDIPSWHFLTGMPGELAPVWAAYWVEVRAEAGEEDVAHTPGVFLIDRDGTRRWYVSVPLADDGLVAPWAGPRLRDVLVRQVRRLLSE